MEKEKTMVDNSKPMGKSRIYRMLPMEDGLVAQNRILILLWRPALICPDIFGRFYPTDMWDWKAAVKGHWVNDEEEGTNRFVYCPVETARYYEKWFGKKYETGHCEICQTGERASVRYVFQVFDFQKLVNERPLDEGEERPSIQILSGPEMIYKQLWSKMKLGYEFWGNPDVAAARVVNITKDTKKGKRYTDYTVEIEPNPINELSNPQIVDYLKDEGNLLNPVPEAIKLPLSEAHRPQTHSKPASAPVPHSNVPSSTGTASVPANPTTGGGKVRW
jgi:hypothetical protein